MKTELQKLADQLNEQVLECEKTMRKLVSVAHASEDHETKYLVLTELSSRHFGLNTLPHYADKLVEHANNLAKENKE